MIKRPETGTLYPVLATVKYPPGFSGKKGTFLSESARQALSESLRLSGLSLSRYEKNQNGAPVPEDGVYWSISHKLEMVAAVCATIPVGIDLEKIMPRSDGLFNYLATEKEWGLFRERNWENFFKLYTAKEALVKMSGEGVKDLKKCILQKVGLQGLELKYQGNDVSVMHFHCGEYLAALAAASRTVEWKIKFESDGIK
ncbi:MAG: 4'-phosphopantetheinyl transferase superfamily protein [Candidatus Wallbacteria bacterium]|nr:4'-phosphopantetheinyl transferase superfamily protein [Candidatus Wallbacteria bacterium]